MVSEKFLALMDVIPLTREQVAKAVGMAKSNFLAALAGRRPLPASAMSALPGVLGLGGDDKFFLDKVHVWSPRNIDVLKRAIPFVMMPPIRIGPVLGTPHAPLLPMIDKFDKIVVVKLVGDLWPLAKMGPEIISGGQWAPGREGGTLINVPGWMWEKWTIDGDENLDIPPSDIFRFSFPAENYWTWERLVDAASRGGWTAEDVAANLGLEKLAPSRPPIRPPGWEDEDPEDAESPSPR